MIMMIPHPCVISVRFFFLRLTRQFMLFLPLKALYVIITVKKQTRIGLIH